MAINPLRLEIPEQIITDRLLLRTPRLGDGARIIDTVLASLHELKAWMPWATDAYTVADAEDWCRRAASKFITREEASYSLLHRETGRYLGSVSAFILDWRVPKFEIGYWLSTAECGQGFMTEAVKAVTEMTFESLHARRIEIHTDALNTRSGRVAERCGYILEGTFKNECRNANGDLRDTRIYAATR
jgi:RimJ/RimL family protein N-acetyltransferase